MQRISFKYVASTHQEHVVSKSLVLQYFLLFDDTNSNKILTNGPCTFKL